MATHTIHLEHGDYIQVSDDEYARLCRAADSLGGFDLQGFIEYCGDEDNFIREALRDGVVYIGDSVVEIVNRKTVAAHISPNATLREKLRVVSILKEGMLDQMLRDT